MRIAAIVLAAGAATRFGAPKQLAMLDGRPLVWHALATTAALPQVGPAVVVLGAHADAVAPQLGAGRHRVVRCTGWREGIAASLRCGLEAAGPLDAALVLLADQPFVGTPLVLRVLGDGLPAVLGGDHDAARPVGADGTPGHPVLLGPAGIGTALRTQGDAGPVRALDPDRVMAIATDDPAAAFDIDYPADLRAARERRHRSRLAA